MSRDESGPLGHRRDGDWHPTRPADTEQPATEQGTGRPWRGARTGGER